MSESLTNFQLIRSIKPVQFISSSVTMATYAAKITWSGAGELCGSASGFSTRCSCNTDPALCSGGSILIHVLPLGLLKKSVHLQLSLLREPGLNESDYTNYNWLLLELL